MERASRTTTGVGEEEDLNAQAVDSESEPEAPASSSASGAPLRTKSQILMRSKAATTPTAKNTADQEQTRKKTLDTVAQLGKKTAKSSTVNAKPPVTTILRHGKAAATDDNGPLSAVVAGALMSCAGADATTPTDQGNGYPPPGPATGAQEYQTSSQENF